MFSNLTVTLLLKSDIATIAQIHKSESRVGLHKFLTLPFLTHYYSTLLDIHGVDTAVVKDTQGNISGFGFISYNQDLLLKLLYQNATPLLLHFILSISMAISNPKNWPELYNRMSRLIRFSLWERTAAVPNTRHCAEMGFILINTLAPTPRFKISPLIFNYLCEQAKKRNYEKVISRVSKGHAASILMHKVNRFHLLRESKSEIIFERTIQ